MSRPRRILPWLVALGLLVTDFLTKRLVLAHAADLRAERLEVLGEYLRLAYVRNPGAAMGLFPVGRWVLVGISALAAGFLVYLLLTGSARHGLRRVAMGAILGGALGNLVDRLFYGGLVVDFIDVGIGAHRFYTFNVADIGVSVGGALLFLSLLTEGRDEREKRPPAVPPDTAAPPAGPDAGPGPRGHE